MTRLDATTPRSEVPAADLQRLTANTVRGLAMDAVQAARCGHPGMPMGRADAAVVLWSRFLKFNPVDPHWADRDRFVLSAGHGSLLLYSLLHLTGFDLPLQELKNFRQWGSRTPGHPEYGHTPGVETTTGPLGQGVANAVGLALAERWLAAHFNRPGFDVVDHRTYAIAGDGDLMEGVTYEACSLAGHLGLDRLTLLYDDNGITIDGSTALAFSEDVRARFEAAGWHVQSVDGHDAAALEVAVEAARAQTQRPSLIACKTHIGFGSPNRQDTAKAHGEPLGEAELRLTKEKLDWPVEPSFRVPPEVREFMRAAGAAGTAASLQWMDLFRGYGAAHAELAREFTRLTRGQLPEGWQASLPGFSTEKPLATRAASGMVLNAIAPGLPELVGGSADLTGSNNTLPKGESSWARGDFSGRYVRYGIREHAMGGIMNGLALHGLRPYGGTFLVFSDYMRAPIRLAAMMGLPVVYVFTHDSIGLGEDGPTHQPIEHLASLRAIPNLAVVRPGDAAEVREAWRLALERRDGPTALVLTRQALPVLDRNRYGKAEQATRGAYVLADEGDARLVIMASGSEVQIALEARERLLKDGVAVRVVSLPCADIFAEQPQEYRDQVLPPGLRARVAIEAGATAGLSRFVGLDGEVIGLDRFGASAPYKELYQRLGLTPEAVVEAGRRVLQRLSGP